jgi:poly(3-hydroxybutyrate) depolymerase
MPSLVRGSPHHDSGDVLDTVEQELAQNTATLNGVDLAPTAGSAAIANVTHAMARGHRQRGNGVRVPVPMNGHTTQDINAADLILDFFSQHPRPGKNAKY